jgi:hypothetical protein
MLSFERRSLRPPFLIFTKEIRMAARLSAFRPLALVLVTGLAAVAGCGGTATEQVSGKLTANGQPVTGGSLSFAPIGDGSVAATEPAEAPVGSDGSYTVTKGAVAGKHRVSYYPPPVEQGEAQMWDGTGPKPETKKSEYDGMKVSPNEVEVKAGKNDIPLELVPAGGPG